MRAIRTLGTAAAVLALGASAALACGGATASLSTERPVVVATGPQTVTPQTPLIVVPKD
ncbi:MAG: hypothetical protein R3F55_02485 [Alphaproteobacteria bacterium]